MGLPQQEENLRPPTATEENPGPSPFTEIKPWAFTIHGKKTLGLHHSQKENPGPSPFTERKPWAFTIHGTKTLGLYHQREENL